jgi:hypothetical protein
VQASPSNHLNAHRNRTNFAKRFDIESPTQKEKGGKPVAHCLTWTDTWLKRDGKWQIIGVQDAQFPCK